MTDFVNLKVRVDVTDINKATSSMKNMAREGSRGMDDIDRSTKKTNRTLQDSEKTVRGVRSAIVALGGAMAVRQIVQYGDAWTSANNQLRLITESNKELISVQERVLAVSNETRAGFDATATLYSRLVRSTQDLNLTQEDNLRLTELVNKSFAVNGASAQEMEGAIRQLAQGLAAGALRGDEFNSVAEQAPGIMDAIAEKLQMTRGELRDYAAEGQITATIVAESLLEAGEKIDRQFNNAVITMGQQLTVARNNAMEFVGTSEGINNAMQSAGDAVIWLSENLDDLSVIINTVATGLAIRMLPAIAASISPITALAGAVGALTLGFIELKNKKEEAFANAQAMVIAEGAEVIRLKMHSLSEEITDTAEAIDRMREADRKGRAGMVGNAATIANYERALAELVDEYNTYNGELIKAEEAQEQSNETTEEGSELAMRMADASSDLAKSVAKARDEIESKTAAISEYIYELQVATGQIDLTESQEAILAETMKIGEGATMQQVAAAMALASVRNQQEQQAEELADREKERAKQQEALDRERLQAQQRYAEEIQRQWERVRNEMSDAFVDMIMDGDNAFDAIARSFKRMVAQMIADWAASGLMNILGITGAMGGASGVSINTGAAINPMSLILGGGGGGIGGSILSGIGGALGIGGGAAAGSVLPAANAGAGAWAGFYGAAPASSGGLFSGIGASMAANPLMWGAGALLAGHMIHQATNDPDGRHRSMGGFLAAPTSGAPTSSQFSVSPFASGFAPVGFADGPTSQQAAMRNIEQFRFIDQAIVDAALRAGGNVATPGTLGGFGLEGTGSGTFFGRSDTTTDAQFGQQLNSFAVQLARHIGGLSPEVMAQLAGASTAEDIVSVLELAAEATEQGTEVEKDLQRAIEYLDRSNELLYNRNGDLIRSNGEMVVAAGKMAEWSANMPAQLEAAITRHNNRAANRADLTGSNPPTPTAPSRVTAPAFTGGGTVLDSDLSEAAIAMYGSQGQTLSFAEGQRRERVQRNLLRAQMGYDPGTGTWDNSKGGQAGYWAALQDNGNPAQPLADGMDMVERNVQPAILHRGEQVLSARNVQSQAVAMNRIEQLTMTNTKTLLKIRHMQDRLDRLVNPETGLLTRTS